MHKYCVVNVFTMNAGNAVRYPVIIAEIIILLLYLPGNQSISGEGNHTIVDRTVWENITVNATVIDVRPGGILIIENSTILMNTTDPGAGLFVNGILFMNNSRIMPASGHVEGSEGYKFKIRGAASVHHNLIEHPKSLELFNESIRISNNLINGTSTDGVYIHGDPGADKSVIIENNTISHAGLNGFHLENGRAVLRDNVVNDVTYDGIYAYNSVVEVRNCSFSGMGRYLFYLGMGSTLEVYPGTQGIDKERIKLTDKESLVRIHEDGKISILQLPSSYDGNEHAGIKLFFVAGIGVLGVFGIAYIYYYYHHEVKPKKEEALPDILPLVEETSVQETMESQKLKAQVQRDFGDIAMKGGSFESALEYYTKAIELDPTNDELYTRRGIAFEKIHRYGKALNDFNKAISLNPDNKDAVEGRIRVLDRLEEEKKWIVDEIGETVEEKERVTQVLKALERMEMEDYPAEIRYRILKLRNKIESGEFTEMEEEFGVILRKIKEYVKGEKSKEKHITDLFKKFSHGSYRDAEGKDMITEEKLEEIKRELEFLESHKPKPHIFHQITSIKENIRNGELSNLNKKMKELRRMVREEKMVGKEPDRDLDGKILNQ